MKLAGSIGIQSVPKSCVRSKQSTLVRRRTTADASRPFPAGTLEENHIHADERRPEMHFAPEIVHLSAGRFRKPVINPGEKPEECARRNDVMEMRDDVVGVVQIKVG